MHSESHCDTNTDEHADSSQNTNTDDLFFDDHDDYDSNYDSDHNREVLDTADNDETEEDDPKCSSEFYCIKKGSMYATICNYRFKFLDIINFLAVGTSYSKFLKAYDIDVGKSFFPYEWFDCAEKLDFQHLPAYEDFYSVLKNKNTLEISDKKSKEETEKISAKEVGEENYKHLQHVWKEQNMSSFRDFLIYYNNLDVAPFIKAVEKMQDFYFEKDIDLFKIAISVPGIARNWLFNIARDKNIAFALIH